MAGLFFGNRDINVSITAETRFQFAFLNKTLIATDEADIPIQKFSTVTELTDYLTDNTLTAPNLVAAVTKFLGQTDVSGNSILPEYFYVIGADIADVTADITTLTAAIEAGTAANDFYNLVPIFESVLWQTWFATYGNTNRRISSIFTATQNKVVTDPEKSSRIFGIYDGAAAIQYSNAAWSGRVISQAELVGFKFKKLTGITTDALSDANVSTLEDAGWNGYRTVRGRGETTGSRALDNSSDNESHIDTIITRDNIVYNVAASLHDMFRQNETVQMDIRGRSLVNRAISSALTFLGQKELIAQFEDGSYQFVVNVPTITGAMRSARELTGVTFTYVPNVGMESITVTGQEILEFLGGVE